MRGEQKAIYKPNAQSARAFVLDFQVSRNNLPLCTSHKSGRVCYSSWSGLESPLCIEPSTSGGMQPCEPFSRTAQEGLVVCLIQLTISSRRWPSPYDGDEIFSCALLLSGCCLSSSTRLCLFVFLLNIPPHLPPWPSVPTALCPLAFLCLHLYLFRRKLPVRPKPTQLVAWPWKSTWNMKDGQPAFTSSKRASVLWGSVNTSLWDPWGIKASVNCQGHFPHTRRVTPSFCGWVPGLNRRTRPPVLSRKSSFRGEDNK